MAQDDIKVILARLHDACKVSIDDLDKMVPTIGKPNLCRLVHEGRV